MISGNIGDYSEEYALRNNFVFEALDVADMIGVCGDAAWYWYESFGKLVISGEGNVKYDSNWTSIAEKVKSIEVKDSITSINCGAFEKFVNLEEIRIPFVGKSRTAENHEAVFGYIFNYVVLPYAGGRPTPLAYADYICQYYKLYYDDGEIYDQDEYYYHIPKKINKVIFTGTTIPYRAFMKCSMIKDIVLTNVESIDKEAFYGYKITAHAPKGSAIETYAKSNTNITFEPFCSSSSGHECVVTSTIASTCTTEGYSVYSCLHCDYSYNDDYQPLIDHSYVKTETAPTCTAAGVIKYTCEVCGKNYTETGATATGHSYGEWKPVEGLNESERICSVCGNTVKVVSSGTHGTNITWFIDYNTGVLYISGEGEIGAVSSTTYAPWYTYRNAYSEVVVGEGITDIGAYVFQNHANIKKITFPSTLTSIASYAFHNCTGLEAVCVTDLETWLSYSFAGYVHTPLYYAGNLYCNGELVENIVIPDSFTKIGKYAFTGCTSIKSVVMHDNITEMGDYAFYGCTSLEEVTFSKKMTTVSIRGFMNCASLKDIVFPESVTTIKHHAFTGCSGLENVVMPKTITSIGTDAFAECSTFTVYGEKGSKAQSFASSSSLIFKDISEYNASSESKEYSGFCGENITWVFDSEGKLTLAGSGEVPDYAAATDVPWAEYISLINSIVIGEGITSIGSNIFMNCTVLEEITISSTVTSIGENAFDGCTALKKVHITDFESWCNISFSNIQSNPVMYAKSFYIKGEHITEAELPATITEIKAYVFRYSNLEKITVWGEIANVGSSAFEYCESLTIYGYEGTALETYAIDSSIPFVAIRCEEHTFSEWITTTEPTETTEGEKTRKCTVCKFIETETLPVVLPEVKGKATYTLSGIEAMPGETVSLTLSLKTNTEVNSIALSEFEYDSDVLEFIGFTDTEAIEELCALTPIFDDENEYILIALSEDMIFDGTICTLNFKIKENIEDTVASISANTVAKLNSIVLESTLESAGITVYNYVIGDIDGDRDADLDDAVYLFGYSMLPNLYPVSYPGTMDFNKDGNIDLQDAMMLFRYSMLPDLYPLE